MKSTLLLASVVVATTLLTGCSNKEEPKPLTKKEEMVNSINNLPKWVINSDIPNGIGAVGMSGYSKHGLEIMLPQAEMDARAKLAGKIQTIVSQLGQKSLRSTKLNDLDEFEKSFKQITQTVVKKIPLSGAQRINMYQANDGTLYVHTIIQKKEVAQHLENMQTEYKKKMAEASLSRKSMDEGMKVLDDMVKELNTEIN